MGNSFWPETLKNTSRSILYSGSDLNGKLLVDTVQDTLGYLGIMCK